MSEDRLDRMVERATTEVLRTPGSAERLPALLCRTWPDAPALEVVLALSIVARSLEVYFSAGSPSHRAAADCWRVAALTACEVHAARCLGLAHERARDMNEYWRTMAQTDARSTGAAGDGWPHV
ncbi:MAG: hypothetical protein JJU42_02645 [Rhodobacteraceae bacterium]|nr:hypothetical protein [Paracoccaceae bacterium]